MLLAKFMVNKENQHSKEENPSVKCNSLYKTRDSVNCNLTPVQAIEFARCLLQKAQLILDNNIEDAVVQVWNGGEHNESVSFGLTSKRKGPRRKKKKTPTAVPQ